MHGLIHGLQLLAVGCPSEHGSQSVPNLTPLLLGPVKVHLNLPGSPGIHRLFCYLTNPDVPISSAENYYFCIIIPKAFDLPALPAPDYDQKGRWQGAKPDSAAAIAHFLVTL